MNPCLCHRLITELFSEFDNGCCIRLGYSIINPCKLDNKYATSSSFVGHTSSLTTIIIHHISAVTSLLA